MSSLDLPEARRALEALPRPACWLLCLSGGLDSRVLLDLCARFARHHPIELVTAHVHHGLRPSAEQDAAFCARLTASLPEVRLHRTLRLQIDPHDSLQRAARAQRWAALVELAHALEANVVLTAHHLDDAIETFLINATRGAGSPGLSPYHQPPGAPPFSPPGSALLLARPLRDQSRVQLEAYAASRALTWVEDPTNAKDDYTRNQLRHHVIPPLLQIGESARQGLQHTLEALGSEAARLGTRARVLLDEHLLCDRPFPGALTFPLEALQLCDAPLRARLYQELHRAAHPHRALESAHIAALEALCGPVASASTTGVSLPSVYAERRDQVLCLLPTEARGRAGFFSAPALPVRLPTEQARSGVMPWLSHAIHWEHAQPEGERDDERAWCALTLQEGESVWVRAPLAGERFGGQPLKELLRRAGVRAEDRTRWPCVVIRSPDRSEDRLVVWARMTHDGRGAHEPAGSEGRTLRISVRDRHEAK